MQSAKDSVYAAFRQRLATLNPARVITTAAGTRPGIITVENEPLKTESPSRQLRDVFELHWGAASEVKESSGARRRLLQMECRITYRTAGADPAGADRGRSLGAMDTELLRMCTPPHTPKLDYTQATPAPLGSMVFWGQPEFGPVEDSAERGSSALVLERSVRLPVFFFPEVDTA